MMTDGPNEILLSANCISKASVIHETMHTLGFRHEHNRDDRDEYVTIDKTKLTRGRLDRLFLELLASLTLLNFRRKTEKALPVCYRLLLTLLWLP